MYGSRLIWGRMALSSTKCWNDGFAAIDGASAGVRGGAGGLNDDFADGPLGAEGGGPGAWTGVSMCGFFSASSF